MQVAPMAYGAGDGPGRVGDKTGVISRAGRQLGQFDALDLGPGTTLAGKFQAAAGLQIDFRQQLTFDALQEDIVDFAFIPKVEGPVDIV